VGGGGEVEVGRGCSVLGGGFSGSGGGGSHLFRVVLASFYGMGSVALRFEIQIQRQVPSRVSTRASPVPRAS
jgi:hypothetical protein